MKLIPRLQLVDVSGAVFHYTMDELKGGLFPISTWREGQTVVDRRSLRLPASLPPGEYTLQVSLVAPDGAKTIVGPTPPFGRIVVSSAR